MATASECALPVVLRIKRKREDDPVEALRITKHARIDTLSEAETDSSIFQLAGTVTSVATSEELILEKVRGHSKLAKLNPLAQLTLDDTLQQRRKQQKASRSEHRFKLVAQHREKTNTVSESPAQLKQTNSVCIVDLEEEIQATLPVGVASTKSSNGAITCNNVTLTREKTTAQSPISEEQFVYDLYYTRDLSTQGASTIDWGSVCIRECGMELVHDILDPDDPCYEDDDDDSNDESNWRNDYPDEEDLSPTSSLSNSGDDLNGEYRYRDAYYDEESFSDENGDYYIR